MCMADCSAILRKFDIRFRLPLFEYNDLRYVSRSSALSLKYRIYRYMRRQDRIGDRTQDISLYMSLVETNYRSTGPTSIVTAVCSQRQMVPDQAGHRRTPNSIRFGLNGTDAAPGILRRHQLINLKVVRETAS